MKYFGTVKSFDTTRATAKSSRKRAATTFRFETSAIQWDKNVAPTVGQRLSYDVGQSSRAPALRTKPADHLIGRRKLQLPPVP